VDDLWALKSKGVGLSVRAIGFQDFQLMWSWSTNVTDRQTDGQTTCDCNTSLCTIVHRAVKAAAFGVPGTSTALTYLLKLFYILHDWISFRQWR